MANKLLSPVCNSQLFNNSGTMLSSGTISVFYSGTLTLAPIYANASGGALSNPVTLNAAGRIPNGQLYLDPGISYDIQVKSGTTTLESYTAVSGVPDSSAGVVGAVVTKTFSVATDTSTFALGTSPEDISLVTVFLDGLMLTPTTDFALSGPNLVMASPVLVGCELVVRISRSWSQESLTNYVRAKFFDSWTTVNSQLGYTLTKSPAGVENLLVILDGIVLVPNVDYTWSSGSALTLTLTSNPGVGKVLAAQYNDALGVLTAQTTDVVQYPTTNQYLTAVIDDLRARVAALEAP